MSNDHVSVDRKTLDIVLEAAVAASTDASEVLRRARISLSDAEAAVNIAQMSAELAASRAGYVRHKLAELLKGPS